MIVGFTITDFKGHENDAVGYIRKVCILENPEIAQNIVNVGVGVNVFSNVVTLESLNEQPFETSPIETTDGKYLIASAVNFNIEILYKGDILRLVPTEYFYVDKKDAEGFFPYINEGLLKIIPEYTGNESWVIEDGTWNDDNIWIDTEIWRD